MYKVLITSLMASFLLVGLMGCNRSTVQKTDKVVESVDVQVEKVAKTPSMLQPAAKSVDTTVNVIHSTVHTDDASAKSTPAK